MDYKEVVSKSCSPSLRFACSFCSVFADKPDWCRFKVIDSVNADKAGPSELGGFIGRHITPLETERQFYHARRHFCSGVMMNKFKFHSNNGNLSSTAPLLSISVCLTGKKKLSLLEEHHIGLGSRHQHDL